MTVDNEILCKIFHSIVDIERATDANSADALKEYATLWKAMVIRFGSHDDVKMFCGIISGTALCPIPLVCALLDYSARPFLDTSGIRPLAVRAESLAEPKTFNDWRCITTDDTILTSVNDTSRLFSCFSMGCNSSQPG